MASACLASITRDSGTDMSIQHTINELMVRSQGLTPQATLTIDNYKVWKKQYVFDGLRGVRFGQSFCNHFGIADNILRYERDADRAENYIRKTYVR